MKTYNIELTGNEAKILRLIMGSVMGSGEIRQITDGLFDKFNSLNLDLGPCLSEVFEKTFEKNLIIKNGANLDIFKENEEFKPLDVVSNNSYTKVLVTEGEPYGEYFFCGVVLESDILLKGKFYNDFPKTKYRKL